MSYASKDSAYYRIPYLAERLKAYLEIEEVLYWRDSARGSIIKYMNDSIIGIIIISCTLILITIMTIWSKIKIDQIAKNGYKTFKKLITDLHNEKK